MKQLLLAALLLMSLCMHAQTKKAPFTYPTAAQAAGKGVYQKDSVINSKIVKIYVGSKGGRYYVVPNKINPTLWDRKYLKRK